MKKVFFLGQAPAKPSSKHAVPGTYLHSWLRQIGLNDSDIREHCSFYALVEAFPGSTKHGHLVPQSLQVLAHRPFLIKTLRHINPEIIVPVGKLAISELLEQKHIALDEIIGNKVSLNPLNALGHDIICIPFSHPSGRSTWNARHPEKVQAMLALLKREMVE